MFTPFEGRINVPDFWPVNKETMARELRKVSADALLTCGESAGGRPLRLVRFALAGAPRLWVIGGTHGHEPGTVAACFNLLEILRSGADLRGQQWPHITEFAQKLDITVVPCLNPDGRARCPDSLVGFVAEGMTGMAQSWDHDGNALEIADGMQGIDPEDVLFLGGRYNDDGFLANRPVDEDTTLFVEFQQLLQYMEDTEPPECYIDLHACGFNFYCMNRGFSEPYRQKLRRLDTATRMAIRALGHQYHDAIHGNEAGPDTGVVGNVRILYRRYGTFAFPYEGRSGYIDIPPFCDESDIVDDYLIAVRETMRIGVEEGYIPDGD
ncbi:MAG: M14 family zinc carboxypeptidase [Armatimonadota bacterium]